MREAGGMRALTRGPVRRTPWSLWTSTQSWSPMPRSVASWSLIQKRLAPATKSRHPVRFAVGGVDVPLAVRREAVQHLGRALLGCVLKGPRIDPGTAFAL